MSPGEATLGLIFRVMSELTESQLDLKLDVANGTWLSWQSPTLTASDAAVVRKPERALESKVAEDDGCDVDGSDVTLGIDGRI